MRATLGAVSLVVLTLLGGGCAEGDDGPAEPRAAREPQAGGAPQGPCGDAYAAFVGSLAGLGAALNGSTDDIGALAGSLQEWAGEAPAEIGDDIEAFAAAVASLVEALREAGYDPSSGEEPTASQAAALAEASGSFDTRAVSEAAERIGAYFEEHCGAPTPGAEQE